VLKVSQNAVDADLVSARDAMGEILSAWRAIAPDAQRAAQGGAR